MAAAIAGIFNQHLAAGQAPKSKSASPMAATSGDTNKASGDSATISANDFLTLLVTEMKNQDPTANTDPNQYINQLVQVNSLEQLININQTLSTALGSPTTGSTGSTTQAGAAAHKENALLSVQPAASGVAAASSTALRTAKNAPGNLSVPDAKPAAQRVANALSGQPHTQTVLGGLQRGQ